MAERRRLAGAAASDCAGHRTKLHDFAGRRTRHCRMTRCAPARRLGTCRATITRLAARGRRARGARLDPGAAAGRGAARRFAVPIHGAGAAACPLVRWRVETEQGGPVAGEVAPGLAGARGAGHLRASGTSGWRSSCRRCHPATTGSWLEKADGAPAGLDPPHRGPSTLLRAEAIRAGRRLWGPAIQLYTLRSDRNWGIGDFTDLAGFAAGGRGPRRRRRRAQSAARPVPADPTLCGPYSPSSRNFLNVLYIDPEAIPEFERCDEAAGWWTRRNSRRASRAAGGDFVDYVGRHDLQAGGPPAAVHAVRAGRPATSAARSSAVSEASGAPSWKNWLYFMRCRSISWGGADRRLARLAGRATRTRTGPRCRLRGRGRHGRVSLLAAVAMRRCQLEAAEQPRARRAAPRPVHGPRGGSNGGGAETWAVPGLYALGATVGCAAGPAGAAGPGLGHPADAARRTPARTRPTPFIALLRANMRHGGALRIDHVMMLLRLWWVPRGRPSAEGAYVITRSTT
jgi:hypothetical protein